MESASQSRRLSKIEQIEDLRDAMLWLREYFDAQWNVSAGFNVAEVAHVEQSSIPGSYSQSQNISISDSAKRGFVYCQRNSMLADASSGKVDC